MNIRIGKILITAILFFAFLFTVSCGNPCEKHTDENGDGKCDICDETFSDSPCAECNDANGDGICDLCNNPTLPPPCEIHSDENGDGVCDVCSAPAGAPAEEILLIDQNGSQLTAKFRIVIPDNPPSGIIKAVDYLVRDLAKLGVEVERVTESEAEEQECEILVGNVTSRGKKYEFYRYDLGEKGYTVRIIDKKIIIQAGSDEKINDAVASFKTNFLGIKSSTKKLGKVTVLSNLEDTVIQDDYRIKTLTLMGEDMKGYKLVVDKSDREIMAAAEEIVRYFYTQTGYYFEIVPFENAPTSRIISISKTAKTGGLGYSLTVSEGKLEIVTEYRNAYVSYILDEMERGKEIYNFFIGKIAFATGGKAEFLASDSYTKNMREVCYEDFGAIGDGNTNDIKAITDCHNFANEFDCTVVCKGAKTYYIGAHEAPVEIKTNVDFGKATFIIDDRDIYDTTSWTMALFKVLPGKNNPSGTVKSTYVKKINDSGGIDKDTVKKLELGLDIPAFLYVYNEDHIYFIRYGANQNSGSTQREMILVDKDGNIDPTTPFLFDFDHVTYIAYYGISEEPITINGGNFITRANQCDSDGKYFARNFVVSRSNVTVQNLTHSITDERTGRYEGNPYDHWLSVRTCSNVLLYNCTLQAHRTYYKPAANGSGEVGMGSYDTGASNAIGVTWEKCVQSNFFTSDGKTPDFHTVWDIMGSSGCKNLTYLDSQLSRFDAHEGCYNVKLINSSLFSLRITGGGDFIMENCNYYSRGTVIQLREDYGSFWHGNIILKDLTVHSVNGSDISLVYGLWYNHNFGYRTAFPSEIVIDGLKLSTPVKINLFTEKFVSSTNDILKDELTATGDSTAKPNVNKMAPPLKITVKNNTEKIAIALPDKTLYPFFENTVYDLED